MELINDNLPTTRYQGSKRKLLPWIYSHIYNLDFQSALDVFGGSGIVSYLFKNMGKSVTYNDYLTANYYIGKAFIENSTEILTQDDIDFLFNFDNEADTFIHRTFTGMYYTDEENIWLDNIVRKISLLNSMYSGKQLEYKQALSYYALFQSCLVKRPFNLFHRNNLYLRTNQVPRQFGNKTTWDRNFESHFQKFTIELNGLIFSNMGNNIAINQDAFTISKTNYDLVYIDPPYFSQERSSIESDYSRMYHFLEGIAHYDDWNSLIDYESNNFHLTDNGYKWPAKRVVADRLNRLIAKWSDSIIVLSYKSPGIPSSDELLSIMRQYKHTVDIYELPYTYALSKANNQNRQANELLIIGR
jgi:adenine-specific DNA-methyltransferase